MERKKQTVIRTIILALALANQVLSALGRPVIPVEDGQVETLFTLAFTVASTLWAWWKNNSVTPEAQEADRYLDELKGRGCVETPDYEAGESVSHEQG